MVPKRERVGLRGGTAGQPRQLSVLNLATMQETPLSETRNVDGQMEWLDNNHILYTPSTPHLEIWVAAVDGSALPGMPVSDAVSLATML